MKDLTQIMSGFWEAHAPSRAVSSALAGNFFSCCSAPIRRHATHVANDSGCFPPMHRALAKRAD
jgi:hypothetical protein